MTNPAFDQIALNDLDAELAERHLSDFVRASWPVLHPTTPFADNWHIDAVCDHLQAVIEGDISNLLINIAPRMTKSVMASIDLLAGLRDLACHGRGAAVGRGDHRFADVEKMIDLYSLALGIAATLVAIAFVVVTWMLIFLWRTKVMTQVKDEK